MTSQAYVFVVIGICVLGAAFQTQTGWLYLLGAGSLGIVPLAWACAWWELRGVVARVLPVASSSQGSALTLTLLVERQTVGAAFGLQALLPDGPAHRFMRFWRGHLVPAGWRNEALGYLSRGVPVRGAFSLLTARRGEFPVPDFYLQSAFPLGLIALTRKVESVGRFLVYPVGPRLFDVPWLSPAGRDQGHHERFQAGPGAAPRGVREYRPGDPWRQIHWRTTARLGKPHVKETERERGQSIVIFIDMRSEAHTAETVEHLIAVATSLRDFVRHRGREVELATQPEADPGLESGPEDRQLAWLARINPVAGASAPIGQEGAILLSAVYVPGWQHWAAHFVYCPGEAANPMDATAFCPVATSIPDGLKLERQP